MIKKKLRQETGSVTVLVLATLLAFLTILSTAFLVNTSIRKGQLESSIKIKKIYESELQEEEQIYQRLTQNSIYKEDFLQWNNYRTSGQKLNSCQNGILDVTATSNDPMIFMSNVTSFNPKVYRYIEVKYKISTSIATDMVLFMENEPKDDTYLMYKRIKNDGNWHTVVFDLWTNTAVKNKDVINGWRLDWVNGKNLINMNMQIDYIRVVGAPAEIKNK